MNKSKTRQAIRHSLKAKFVGDDAVEITVTDLLTGTVSVITFNFVANTMSEINVKEGDCADGK